MCDYSLHAVTTRKAVVGDKLITHQFVGGTRGFGDLDPTLQEPVAVCLLPGTEIAFAEPVRAYIDFSGRLPDVLPREAKFTQVNELAPSVHHDCLEFADGTKVMLHFIKEGQRATVLQLPAEPKNEIKKHGLPAPASLVYIGD